MEIKVDIDGKLLHAASPAERQEFQSVLFCAASRVTTEYRGTVDFSDPHHWIFTVPDAYANFTRELLAGREPDSERVSRADFQRHLDDASAIVATWPKWKQGVLGAAIKR